MIGDIIAKSALCVLITGDFNVRSTLHYWWKNDLSALKVLSSIHSPLPMVWVRSSLIQLMFLKLIILIDLIFTNQPNFVTESGVHPPLHTNCHHQIKFAKPNLRVEYPPLYERLIWDYKNADIQSINRVINTWVIPSKVNMLMNKSTSVTIVNIFHNYISNFSKLFFVMIKIPCG